jgi:hypothetical protein
MRLSLVSLNAARRRAAPFAVVEAKTEVSLASPNGGVDQRKSPGWHAQKNLARCHFASVRRRAGNFRLAPKAATSWQPI